jgi:hypothetical protein
MCRMDQDEVADEVCCPAIRIAIIMCAMSRSVNGVPSLYSLPCSAWIMSISSTCVRVSYRPVFHPRLTSDSPEFLFLMMSR